MRALRAMALAALLAIGTVTAVFADDSGGYYVPQTPDRVDQAELVA